MSYHVNQLKMMLGITGLVSFYGITSLAIWFLGPSIGLDYIYQIVLIALLLITLPFVLLFAFLVRRLRRKREAAEAQAQAQAPSSQEPRAAAAPSRVYDELYRSAEEAVQWLRSTRLGGGKAKEAVSALPWFVVADLRGRGRASVGVSSGLAAHSLARQPRARFNVVRPTPHCEWRMTD